MFSAVSSGDIVGPAAHRREIIRIGALLYERRYVVAAEGNLSVRLGGDRFLVTPSAACKGWLEIGELLEIKGDGRTFATDRHSSSEWLLHHEIYGSLPEVGAICHAHPPFATACATFGRWLRALFEKPVRPATAARATDEAHAE